MQLVLALVEQVRQALQRALAHVVAAMAADLLVDLPVAHEQHLLALGAFQPEILRRLLAGDQRAQFRPDEIGQPVHGRGIARMADRAKVAPAARRLIARRRRTERRFLAAS